MSAPRAEPAVQRGTSAPHPPSSSHMSAKAPRIPRRTRDIVLRDFLMRRIVDPKQLACKYEVKQHDIATLRNEQLQDLIQGFRVKIRCNGIRGAGHLGTPGPAAYHPQPERSPKAPKFQQLISLSARLGAEVVSPGPGAYNPNKVDISHKYSLTGRVATSHHGRWCPDPGQYELPSVTGRDCPQWTINKTPRMQQFSPATEPPGQASPGPATYFLPRGNRQVSTAVADWSKRAPAVHPTPGPQDYQEVRVPPVV